MTPRFQDQPDRATGLASLVEVWRRRKWAALVVFSAVFAGVISATLSLPDLYRATASVLVERQEVSEAFVRSSVTAELETRIQTIQQEVMSRARLIDIINRFDLYADLRKKAPLYAVVDRMRRDIQLELKGVEQQMSGRNATIAFALSYTHRDPQTAARIANELASVYVQENSKIRERQAARTADFLKGQLADVKEQLNAQEHRASDFKLQHIGELPQQVEVNLASLERLNTQLRLNSEHQIRAMERRERLEKQLADLDAPPRAAAAAPATPSAQLAKLKQDLIELRRQFTDDYPSVSRLRAEISAFEGQLGPTASDGRAPAAPPDPAPRFQQELRDVQLELASLKDEERALRQSIVAYEQRVENAPKRQEEFEQLSRDYDMIKGRYNTLLQRYQEAQLAENLEQGPRAEQFRVLDPAIPPRDPAAPSRVRVLLLGFVLAISLAFAPVLAAEKLDTTFHSVQELRSFTRVLTLVNIPMIVTPRDVRRRRYRAVLTAISAVAALVLIVAGSYYVAAGNDQIVLMMMSRGRG